MFTPSWQAVVCRSSLLSRSLLVLAFTLVGWAAPARGQAPFPVPAPAEPAQRTVAVDGFTAHYLPLPTPVGDDEGPADVERWLQGFRATLVSVRPLSYREGELPAGTHEVWVEKGKGEWYYLVIGKRADEKSPRLRALFRLYEQDLAVPQLAFDLKLVRKATKLKFSMAAGSFEGHGNLRVGGQPEDEESDPEER